MLNVRNKYLLLLVLWRIKRPRNDLLSAKGSSNNSSCLSSIDNQASRRQLWQQRHSQIAKGNTRRRSSSLMAAAPDALNKSRSIVHYASSLSAVPVHTSPVAPQTVTSASAAARKEAQRGKEEERERIYFFDQGPPQLPAAV